jgi:hypothetical protein
MGELVVSVSIERAVYAVRVDAGNDQGLLLAVREALRLGGTVQITEASEVSKPRTPLGLNEAR